MKRILLFFVFHAFYLDLQSQIKDTLLLPQKLENCIRLQYDNDFFSATDRYYTQGIHLTIIHPVIKYSPISYALIRLKNQSLNYYGLEIAQDCFTPKSIRYDTTKLPGTSFCRYVLCYAYIKFIIAGKENGITNSG